MIISSGCSKPKVPRPSSMAAKTAFGTTVADATLEIPKEFKPLKAQTLGDEVTITSKDWLELSGQLIETGAQLDGDARDRLIKAGHELSHKFYELPYSHTTMSATTQPVGNPWLDAATPLAKPLLVQKVNEMIDGAKTKVIAAAQQTLVDLSGLAKDPLPEVVIQRVVDALNGFRTALVQSKDGTGDSIIDQISETLQKDYILNLEKLRDSSRLDPKAPLSEGLMRLRKSLQEFNAISDFEKQRLTIAINWGIQLAEHNEKIVTSQDALVDLVDFWKNKYFRDLFPVELADVFKNLSDTQITTLATENRTPLFNDVQWPQVKVRQDYLMMPDLEVLGQYVQNNGALLDAAKWSALKSNQGQKLQSLLKDKKVVNLINLLVNVEPVNGDDDKKAVITNNWLGMSNRLSFPENLRKAFSMFNDRDLELLKADQRKFNDTVWLAMTGHAKLAIARYEIIAGLESFGAKPGERLTAAQGLENFKKYFREKIAGATRARVNHAVYPVAEGLSKEISDALTEILDKQKQSADKTAAQSLTVYARYYIGKLIFGVNDLVKRSLDDANASQDDEVLAKFPLPILERDTLHFVRKSGAFENTPWCQEPF